MSACYADGDCCSHKCGGGECFASECAPNVPSGPCAIDDDCRCGSCREGQCLCLGAGSEVPETTSGAKRCCTGQVQDGRCHCAASFPPAEEGNAVCESDADCCNGTCRSNGRCACDVAGEPCVSPDLCCNGYCNDGKCG